MAKPEESDRLKVISALSNQALCQYDGLRREHERTKTEFKQMQLERDEALQKLKEFEDVSHKVIEEVSTIQENLEIEKTCRQSVEALASKLNRQNKSLKRKSMMYLAHLDPDIIANIGLEDEEDEEVVQEENVGCSSSHCQLVITELRDRLEVTREEKRQISLDLEATREQLWQLREEVLREKQDNTVLIAEAVQQRKLLAKYNRG